MTQWSVCMTFYSDDPSSNPAEVYQQFFFCNISDETNDNKQKEKWIGESFLS